MKAILDKGYKIKSEDELYKLYNANRGFIFNYFTDGKTADKNNILHAAGCDWMKNSNLTYAKYFFKTIEEAEECLKRELGDQDVRWKKCDSCSALGQPFLEDIEQILVKETEIKSNIKKDNGIFKESIVQNILVNYLKKKGYNIKEMHKVTNGIIDIVADRNNEFIVIEVKGEDRGGYTSAEMNFQIGIGQILSRMTNQNVIYALAFPLTSDFKKVLKKYKNTSGLQKLKLFFYIIKEDNNVEYCDSESLVEMIGDF